MSKNIKCWIMILFIIIFDISKCKVINKCQAKESYQPDNTIFINEICAKNTTYTSGNDECYDWIELYNCGDITVDISGYGLSDKAVEPYKFVFPNNTAIGAGEYLLVFFGITDENEGHLSVPFGLSTSGETIILSEKYGGKGIIDSVRFDCLEADISYGRVQKNDRIGSADEIEQYKTSWCCLERISPGLRNEPDYIRLNPPSFSRESGVYGESFNLEISADENCIIYYTTDGSIPTVESTVYNNPICIYDRSPEANEISSITDISTNPIPVQKPRDPVRKAFIIRAISISSSIKKTSKVITNIYYIDSGNKTYLSNLPIYSLVADNKDLFSYDNGIYVTGETNTKWKNGRDYDPSIKWFMQPANYHNKGMEWEIQANLIILNKKGVFLNQDIGIRINGASSRAYPQKSISLIPRTKYGMSNLICDPFDSNNKSLKGKIINKYNGLVLKNEGNDYNLLRFKNKIRHQMIRQRSVLTQAMSPCILFINGEYWGQYEITEQVSAGTVAEHYDVDEDRLCVMKNNRLKDGDEQGVREWGELLTWIKSETDFTNKANYNRIQNEIDLDSFIDYVCSEVYVANRDWITNNTAWWKTMYTDDRVDCADGRWRFIMYDVDSPPQKDYDTFSEKMQEDNQFISELFNKIIYNDDFRQKFTTSFMDIANDNFDSDIVCSLIDEYASEYEPYAMDYYKRFESQTALTHEQYQGWVDELKDFFRERRGYVTGYLKEALSLTGDLVDVEILIDDKEGDVSLNTVGKLSDSIQGAIHPWKGQYFTDFPIHVSAEAADGYVFSHYSLSDGRTIREEDTDIELSKSVTITPVFIKDNES